MVILDQGSTLYYSTSVLLFLSWEFLGQRVTQIPINSCPTLSMHGGLFLAQGSIVYYIISVHPFLGVSRSKSHSNSYKQQSYSFYAWWLEGGVVVPFNEALLTFYKR